MKLDGMRDLKQRHLFGKRKPITKIKFQVITIQRLTMLIISEMTYYKIV